MGNLYRQTQLTILHGSFEQLEAGVKVQDGCIEVCEIGKTRRTVINKEGLSRVSRSSSPSERPPDLNQGLSLCE